jgi:hypothetical protein
MLNRPCRKDDFDPLYDRNLNYMNCYILGETLDSHSKFLVGFVMVIFLVFGVVLIVLCLGSNVTWLCELAILDCQFIFLCRLPKYRIVSATDTEWNNTFKSLIHSCWRRCWMNFFFFLFFFWNRKGTTKYQNSDLV